jgi:hypothetical protein
VITRTSFFAAAAIVSLVLAVGAGGCTSPTDQFFTVHFRNDLGRDVTFTACRDDDCADRYGASPVAAGRTVEGLTSSFGVRNNWRIEDASGRALGCLPLEIDGKWQDVVIPFSKAEPCPGHVPLRIDDLPHGEPLKGP